MRHSLAHARVGPLLSIRFFTSLSFAIFETSFALWAIAALGITAQLNGIILAYVGVLSVFVQLFLIGKLTARYSDDTLILSCVGIAATSLAIWGFVPGVGLLVALMPALSVGLAVTNTIVTSALSKAVDRDEVGGVLGLQASIMSFTRIPAPVIAGLLIERAAVWAPGVAAGAVAGLMVPYAYAKLCVHPDRKSCPDDDLLGRPPAEPVPETAPPETAEKGS